MRHWFVRYMATYHDVSKYFIFLDKKKFKKNPVRKGIEIVVTSMKQVYKIKLRHFLQATAVQAAIVQPWDGDFIFEISKVYLYPIDIYPKYGLK